MATTVKDQTKMVDVNVETTLNIADVADYLEYCMGEKIPVCLWSSPGVGKSSVIRDLTARMKVQFWDIRAVLLDAVDLRGIPYVDQSVSPAVTRWARPGFLPNEGEEGIINLDEINRAAVMVQNGLFQLTLDRKIGEYTLPENVHMVACCNRETDGGGVYRMPQGLANRFNHVAIDTDIHAWTKWGIHHDIHPATLAFLRSKPDLLNQFHHTDKAFPTPRTWEQVSKLTYSLEKNPTNNRHALKLFKGSVGHGAGHEYHVYWRMAAELPSPDAIRLNPKGAPVPSKTDQLYAITAALAKYLTASNIDAIMEYLNRLPVEHNVCCIRDAAQRDPNLTVTKAFMKWSDDHGEVLGWPGH